MKAQIAKMATGTAILTALLLMPVVGLGAPSGVDLGVTDTSQELPEGVTAEKIATGEELFASQGCAVCHGAEGAGKPGMTGSLTDTEWKFAEGGTFAALVQVTKDGLTPAQTGGMPMPNAGSKKLTDAQVEALAAYVWRISH